MSDDVLDRAPVLSRDGIVEYRASALGGCLRSLALARQGFEPVAPPKQMLEVFQAGHETERQAWQKGLLKGTAQNYVRLPVTDTICITGHLDSWDRVWVPRPQQKEGDLGVRAGPGSRMYEVKSQSKNEWGPIRESQMWSRYQWQFSVYILATGHPLTVVRVLRDKEGNVSDSVEEVFVDPPRTLVEVKARVLAVELLARKDLTDVPCDPIMFPCPYFYTHPQDDAAVREYVDDDNAVTLAAQYSEAAREQRLAKQRSDAARKTLLTWMGDKEKIELPGGWKVTRYETKERLVPARTQKAYWGLRVTPPKEDDAEPTVESS